LKIGRFILSATILCGCWLFVPIATTAYADQLKISWSGVFGDGMAIVDVTDEGSDRFRITSVTDATQSGLSLSLLNPGTYGDNDNLIFPHSSEKLDNNGFSFSDGQNDYDIFWGFTSPAGYYECSSSESNCIGIDSMVGQKLTAFSITRVRRQAGGGN
jgi:hypothetical protein